MNRIKQYFIFIFILTCSISFAQTDTATVRGTIKIAKPKDGTIYIKAIPNFNRYDLSKIKKNVSRDQLFQPFPVAAGYPYPFNYTKYFNDNFRSKQIDLKGKAADTVVLEVKVLSNGKIYIKDKSPTFMVAGVPAVYDNKRGAYELNSLHLNCLNFMKQIKKWFPGYVVFPKKDKFKGETVIKPDKKNLDVTGTVTLLFSTTPFED